MDQTLELEKKYQKSVAKECQHLKYSFAKIQRTPKPDLNGTSPEQEEILEIWESFCARFSRVVDIYLTKYLKLKVKQSDPAFDGGLKDYLLLAEKIGQLNDVERWMKARGLRNEQAHEYTEEGFSFFLDRIVDETKFVLEQLKDFK